MEPVASLFQSSHFLTAVLSGLGVGLIVGMTGVGGGSLMTPLLMGVFKLNPATAIGTDLWFAALTKSGGALAHARQGQLDWRITRWLLTGSLPASVATVAWMHATGLGKSAMSVLSMALGVALLLTALVLINQKACQRLGFKLERFTQGPHQAALNTAAGAVLGVLVTLSSVGAGALGVTMLVLLHPRLKPQTLVGTDIAHAVPLTLVAGVGHATLGHVDWALLAMLLVGSLPGIWVGARLTLRMPATWMRTLLCASLVTAGFKVIY